MQTVREYLRHLRSPSWIQDLDNTQTLRSELQDSAENKTLHWLSQQPHTQQPAQVPLIRELAGVGMECNSSATSPARPQQLGPLIVMPAWDRRSLLVPPGLLVLEPTSAMDAVVESRAPPLPLPLAVHSAYWKGASAHNVTTETVHEGA